MTDWLAFGRQVAGDLDAVLAEHPTRLEREPVVGAGEGGDDTTAIDAAAERAAVARLEELARGRRRVHARFGGVGRAFLRGGRLRASSSTPSTGA